MMIFEDQETPKIPNQQSSGGEDPVIVATLHRDEQTAFDPGKER